MSLQLVGRHSGYILKTLENLIKRSFSECGGDKKKKEKKILRTYNIPHPPKDPPEDYHPDCVEHDAIDAPENLPASIFRPFKSKCEVLGPGADKKSCYKNSEYYAFHRYSFSNLHMATMELREQRLQNSNSECKADTVDKEDGDCKENKVDDGDVDGDCKSDCNENKVEDEDGKGNGDCKGDCNENKVKDGDGNGNGDCNSDCKEEKGGDGDNDNKCTK